MMAKDAVISRSLLSLECRELSFVFPEAAWTLEALEVATSLLLLCFPPGDMDGLSSLSSIHCSTGA